MANERNSERKNDIDLSKYLIISLVSTVILCVVFAGVNYVVIENLLTQKISKISLSQDDLENEDEDEIQGGIIVDLGDFILNLCDEPQKKYLKVNVAIEVSQKEDAFLKPDTAQKNSGIHGENVQADPMDGVQKEMLRYKPAIRDAIITNLSSKTSVELSSAAGKELAKEQITNDINSILGGDREVLRVSFGQFIIQ